MALSNVTIKVTPEELNNTAQQVMNLIGQFRREFETSVSLVERTRYYWVGKAGDRYRTDYINKKSNVEEAVKVMQECPQDLIEIAGTYVQVEKGNVQTGNSLQTNYL